MKYNGIQGEQLGEEESGKTSARKINRNLRLKIFSGDFCNFAEEKEDNSRFTVEIITKLVKYIYYDDEKYHKYLKNI